MGYMPEIMYLVFSLLIQRVHQSCVFVKGYTIIAEKYRPEPRVEPLVSQLTYEYSTNRAIQVVYNTVM